MYVALAFSRNRASLPAQPSCLISRAPLRHWARNCSSLRRIRPMPFASIGRLKEWRADALVIVETGLFLFHRKSLIEEATRNRWPTVNSSRQYAEVGG